MIDSAWPARRTRASGRRPTAPAASQDVTGTAEMISR